jgi:hypothetical protein
MEAAGSSLKSSSPSKAKKFRVAMAGRGGGRGRA